MSNALPQDSLIGTQLGGYVIEALLGKGAMGAVYRAMQVSLNRHVALKVMAGHLVGSEESAARFWREARAAAAINHPNLVQVYDFGESGGVYYYAMELVDGLSLGAYLRRGDRFTERECIEVGREVTLALRAAHRAGVIHRDLKPDNLMLNSEGVVKVADLGVARFRQMDGGEDSLTMTGVGVGTPAFMSPEQIRGGKETDHRSDFYALGATLFQLATCRLPFPGQTVGEILEKQFTAAAPRARDVNPALGDAFSNLVARLMAKDPAARPQTHEEILVALEGCLRVVTGEEGGASRIRMADSPAGAWPVRLLRLWPAWAGAAAVVAVAGLLMTRGAKEADPWNRLSGGAARAPIAERATEDTASPEVRGQEPATPPPVAVPAAKADIPVAPGSAGAAREAGAPVGSVVQPPAGAVAPASGTGVAVGSFDLATATKDKPYVNSLGMKFVPIPGTKVLFSIWETRVKDYEAFVKESGRNRSEAPDFEQGPDHPVVKVKWDDAKAFCTWLSQRERLEYRLPTDDEWSAAVGGGQYPWGDEWLPHDGAENIGGEEAKIGKLDDPGKVLVGYRDGHPRTSPVGSYRSNRLGLFDMGGNAREWTEDWYTEALHEKHKADGGGGQLTPEQMEDIKKGNVYRVARGCYWRIAVSGLLKSSFRHPQLAGDWTGNGIGFRCVLVAAADTSVASGVAPLASASESVSGNVAKTAAPSVSPITKFSSATSDRPFVNVLGMRFVPVPGTKVLFSVWETRVKDFEAFVKESGYAWRRSPNHASEQAADDPVTMVDWADVNAFCGWLSKKEAKEYRLPTDAEWDAAVGTGRYSWGDQWPPPDGVENIAGEESVSGDRASKPRAAVTGYRDDHPGIANVGCGKPNAVGLFDMGGNVREWVGGWYTAEIFERRARARVQEYWPEELIYERQRVGADPNLKAAAIADLERGNVCRMIRGGCWFDSGQKMLDSSARMPIRPEQTRAECGFRCVVVASSP